MVLTKTKTRKPAIVIGQTEHAKLTRLAEAAVNRLPEVAEELLRELDRARLVPDARVRDDVVRMGSQLHYVTDAGDARTVTLVYPGEADIEAGKISIMTPIGTALIGLAPGQTIAWEARDGRPLRLTVESVTRPDRVAV